MIQRTNSFWNQRVILTIIAVLLTNLLASAYKFEVDGIYYNVSGTNAIVTYKTTSYNSYSGEVTIPKNVTYNGTTYTVSSIGDYAFCKSTGLTLVSIPTSVTTIGKYAFSGCTKLTTVSFSYGLTTIGDYAFNACSALSFVSLPNSLISIGDYAFNACSALSFVSLPNSLISIGNYAFKACSSLSSLTLPYNLNSIGEWAFTECTSISNVMIPMSVTSIGTGAFSGCYGIKSLSVESSNSVYDSRNICNAIVHKATNTLVVGCQKTTIPSTVKSIGEYAFDGCSTLTSISIPSSVTAIAKYAFNKCTGLTDVTIPSSVTSIGMYAFSGCTGLITATINNGSIDNYAFSGCSKLAGITLGTGVTKIGSYVFNSSTSLSEVICNAVTPPSISSYSFPSTVYSNAKLCVPSSSINTYKTTSYWKNFTNNTGFDFINNNLFYLKTSSNTVSLVHLKSGVNGVIVIPQSVSNGGVSYKVTAIAQNAFRNKTGITSVTLPNSIVEIGDYSFYGCTGLTSISIPNSVKTIGQYAFRGCSNLSSLSLGNSLTTIGNYAFAGCPLLTTLTFPDSLISVGDYAFNNSTALTKIFSNAATPPSLSSNTFASSIYSKATLFVKSASLNAYKEAYYWKQFTKTVGWDFVSNSVYYSITGNNTVSVVYLSDDFNGALTIYSSVTYSGKTYTVTAINDYAFYKCVGLTKLSIPSTVTSIGNYAVYGCSGLTSLTMGSGVTTIGDYAFYGCTAIVSLNLQKIITIGTYAFNGCTGLTSVVIGPNASSIGNYAFSGCSNINSLTWNAVNCASMGNMPKNKIQTVKIGGGVVTLPNDFVRASIITSVTIPNSVTTIGNYAFYQCTDLSEVYLGSGLSTIGNYAFAGCTKISNITIPNSVKTINGYAFNGCTGLTSLTIGSGVTSIGNYAFAGCTNLKKIVCLANTPPTIYAYTFPNTIYSTATLTVPSGCISAYKSANYWKSFKNIVSSYDFMVNGIYYRIIGANTVAVTYKNTDYNSYSGVVTIPSTVTYNGIDYYVTSIDEHAFYNSTELTQVTIPMWVTEIGNYAFANCTKLKKVTIGDRVATIGSYAFYGCSKLQVINIPNSVKTINSYAFSGCTGATSLTIGVNVTSIGQGAFQNTDNLTTFTWNAQNCSSTGGISTANITAVSIGSSVKIIPANFVKGSKITKINIPYNVTTIGSYAFAECNALKDAILSSSITSIGSYAFASCANLEKVVIYKLTPPSGATGMFPDNQLIYVPDRNNYINYSYWKNYNIKSIYSVEPTLTRAKVSVGDDIKLLKVYSFVYDESFPAENDHILEISYDIINNAATVTGLLPDKGYVVYFDVTIGQDVYHFNSQYNTKPVTFGSLQCSSTQTTLSPSFRVNRDEDFILDACGFGGYSDAVGSIKETTADGYLIGAKITGLSPGTSYYYTPWVQFKGVKYYGFGNNLYTSSIAVNRSGTVGPTNVNYTASYSAGDAHVTNTYFTFNGNKSKVLRETGLDPQTSYGYYYTVETTSGNQTNSYTFKTSALNMEAQPAKMLTNTTVMLIAVTNMSDEETSCGFEWRRYDAPEEMASTKVYCPVYGGTMAGTLKYMTENIYYKYRPFYRSSTGKEYYGDWKAFITADAGVEFDPVVYTYNSPSVGTTEATLQGVAICGSKEITRQGFEYWPKNTTLNVKLSSKPTQVTATGERMSKTVTDLLPGTKYAFRAFATAGGKTTYGEEVQFVTLSNRYDVNLDGEVSLADINVLIDLILSETPSLIGDVNGDGEISIADINAIINEILK